jgi:hypothetical protein
VKQAQEAKKQADALKELARQRSKLPGRYCSCTTHRVDFTPSNKWHQCPKCVPRWQAARSAVRWSDGAYVMCGLCLRAPGAL